MSISFPFKMIPFHGAILNFGGGVTGNMFEYFCRGGRWADRFACTFWYLDRDVDPFLEINRWLVFDGF